MENSMIASSEGGDETQPAVGNNHSHSHSHGGGGPCGGGDEQTPQLFCLRWNNYQSNLTNVFDQLLQNESFVDVTLACADGHTVKAHKMVLSACSPYFQALFFENPCKHPIVILKDIKWTELKAAVEFMYKGEINVCQEQIAPLLKVAESLKIRGLADVSNEHDFAQRDSKSPTSAAETVARSPSRSNSSANSGQPPSKKRRRASADRSSTSTGEDTISVINSPSRALELVTSPSSSSIGTTSICNGMTSTHNASSTSCSQQQQQQQHQQQQSQSQAGRPSQSSTPQSPSNMAPLPIPPPPPTLPSTSSVADDMEIKPGIAEMIREEERTGQEKSSSVRVNMTFQKSTSLTYIQVTVAKMLESSQAWLNASTSLAYYVSAASASAAAAAVSTGTGATSAQNSNTASSGSCSGTGSLKLKVPTWTQAQLKEAIQAVVTQQMRFTQASTYFGIPKGTLYDNILGKTKRMQALEEAALSQEEETAVLEFCCQISESPYNRRTRKSLNEVLTFVQNLRQRKDPAFEFKGLSGFRWWWAFCKKHSIVSLHYSGTTPNNKADSYQYQLQSMWQKCWNTNQSLVHNLRFRERGPLKSWRPETMAEAILSVLKEGLSLSQAARKYDIPYPTFVLYANRVHNMLGPSVDGGSDLRPKGRGRPQRILLGYWPEDHIQNVIRAVVFRDPQHIKDEPLNLGYPRISCFQEPLNMYGNNNSCLNSPEPPVSPNSTAAVIAMAQGLRQQVLAAAAAHSNNDNNFGFFSSQCANGSPSLLMATPLQSPNSTPPASPVSNENLEVGIGVTGVPFKSTDNFPVKSEILFNDEIEDLVMKSPHSRTPTSSADQPKPLPLVLEQRSD